MRARMTASVSSPSGVVPAPRWSRCRRSARATPGSARAPRRRAAPSRTPPAGRRPPPRQHQPEVVHHHQRQRQAEAREQVPPADGRDGVRRGRSAELRVAQRGELSPELPVVAVFVRHAPRLHDQPLAGTVGGRPCYARDCTGRRTTMPPRFPDRRLPSLLAALAAAGRADLRRRPARTMPLAARVARAFCAHRFACCSPFEISAMTSDRYNNEADCVEFATLAARQQLGTVEGAIAQGRITIDDARADACLKAYRDQPAPPTASCSRVRVRLPGAERGRAARLVPGHAGRPRGRTTARATSPRNACTDRAASAAPRASRATRRPGAGGTGGR